MASALLFAGAGSSRPGLIAYTFCSFVLAAIVLELVRGTRATGSLVTLVSRNRRRYGGYIVHAAIVLLAIGVAGSSAYQTQVDRPLALGQSMTVDGYTLTNRGVFTSNSPSVSKTYAVLAVTGKYDGTIKPVLANYKIPPEPAKNVSIKTDWLRAQDLYVIPDELHPKTGLIYVQVLVKPLVNFVWIAGFVFLFGSAVAMWPDAREQRRLVARLAPARA